MIEKQHRPAPQYGIHDIEVKRDRQRLYEQDMERIARGLAEDAEGALILHAWNDDGD